MSQKLNQAYTVLFRTIAGFLESGCTRKAAALAYYATFSLAPLLVLVIALLGLLVNPEDIRGQLGKEIEASVGKEGAKQIQLMMQAAEFRLQGAWASFISLGLIVFGASSLVEQLKVALNETWRVQLKKQKISLLGYISQRLVLLTLVLVIGLILIGTVMISSVLNALSGSLHHLLPREVSLLGLNLADHLVSLIMTASLFAFMFRVLPAVKLEWRDVWLGAFFTSLLFVGGKYALGIYLGSSNMASAYGAAGSLALVLVWIYYTSMIFLLGAEFTRVWSEYCGRWIAPRSGAVRVIKPTELSRFCGKRPKDSEDSHDEQPLEFEFAGAGTYSFEPSGGEGGD